MESLNKLKQEIMLYRGSISGHYLAFELSDKCRAELLGVFRPQFSKVICHHVTIEFNVQAEKLKTLVHNLGDNPQVLVVGKAEGNGIECLAVSINGETQRPDGSFYHVTLSLNAPHKPVESNTLKDKVNHCMHPMKLEGAFKLLKK